MAEPQSISSLFSDVLGPMSNAEAQLQADRALGEQLQKGSAATLFAPERARRLTGALGKATGIDTRSPEERQAEQNKKMISGAMQQAAQQFPNSRSKQLNAVAQQLMQQNMPAQAAKFRDAAQAAELQEAKIYSERQKGFASEQSGLKSKAETATEKATRQGEVDKLAAQITKENELAAKAGSAKRLTEAQIATEILQREPSLSLIEAQQAAAQALADQRTTDTKLAKAAAPLERNLIRAQTAAENAGVKLDEKRVKLVASQIDTEAVKQEAERANISETEAKEKLVDAELERYIAMTPLEIIQANTEISKNNTQAELNRARLGDIGMTEFTRNLEQLDKSEEEKQKLLDRYINAKASSGGVTGMGTKTTEIKLDLVKTGIDLAEGSGQAMDSASKMVSLIPSLDVGILATPKSILSRVGAEFGIDSAQQSNFANQMFDLLRGGSVLEAAGNLKGALSDKDLLFLQKSVAGRELSAQVILDAFSSLYYERYADQKISQHMEELLNLDDAQIRNMPIGKLKADYRKLYRSEAMGILPLPVLE